MRDHHRSGVGRRAAGYGDPEPENLLDVFGPVVDLAGKDRTNDFVLPDIRIEVLEQGPQGIAAADSIEQGFFLNGGHERLTNRPRP